MSEPMGKVVRHNGYAHGYEYEYALLWCVYIAVCVFAIYMIADNGYFSHLFDNDPTRISSFIILLLLIGTVHCAFRMYFVTQEFRQIKKIQYTLENHNQINDHNFIASSHIWNFIKSVTDMYHQPSFEASCNENNIQPFIQILTEKLSGQHEYGWFVTGLLIKLGLLGTVVGFVLMLVSLSSIQVLEFSNLQEMISNMAVGMGVALITTLIGLTASILLGFQYLLLDRATDTLISRGVQACNFYMTHANYSESVNDIWITT